MDVKLNLNFYSKEEAELELNKFAKNSWERKPVENGSIFGLTKKYWSTKVAETDIIKKISKIVDLPQMLFIWGDRGNGKTIAVQWYLEEISKQAWEWDIKYITLTELIMDLYALEFNERKEYIDELVSEYEVLAIDEIDKVTLTDYKEEMIFYLFDKRLSNLKYTILTSNTDTKNLGERLKQNIVSRILDDCIKIHSDGKVLR